MGLRKDITTAVSVLRRILRSWSNRREVERRRAHHSPPAPESASIVAYFADPAINLYQLRQWYAPLKELEARWPVTIIARSPSAVLELWDECPLPVAYLRRVSELERFVHTQEIKIVFYVNQNAKNFQMFRYGRMWHVFINHGESDKIYMTTNQFKAYDYSLVAGEAAIDRLRHKLWDFDLDKRAIAVGRPQADHFAGELPYTPDERTVVLYAPTWEGDRAAAAYGSLVSHGLAIVTALLASGEHRLIYRPHPRSGAVDATHRNANAQIIAAIERANSANPTAQHLYDSGSQLGWQLVAADVAITDISAMVYDRLATGKPLLVTRPESLAAEINESGFLGACEWLTAIDAADVVEHIARVQTDEATQVGLKYWAKRHFGDTTPGAATRRFHEAIEHLMAQWEVHATVHRDDHQDSESDPFDNDGDEDELPVD